MFDPLFRLLHKIENIIPIVVILGLGTALLLYITGNADIAQQIVFTILIIGTFPFVVGMIESMMRKEFGIDLLAAVSIFSSLLIGEYVAGAVILLMLSGGEALENFALRRARKDLTSLLSKAPTIAHLKKGSTLTDIAAAEVKKDHIIVVKPGEIIPADALVLNGTSTVDESTLTGESIPVEKTAHSQVLSGSTNGAGVLEIQALRNNKDSHYEQIVSLVKTAEKQKAPFVRLADRYSIWFTAVALSLAAAGWLISGTPNRALAVLVVATPCPLILATPIAFASGISRAAKRGIIVKNGGVLEQLAKAKSFLFDKTGTLTFGVPLVHQVDTVSSLPASKIIMYAASLDQLSAHILAKSLVTYAHTHHHALTYPTKFQEELGKGVTGEIHSKKVLFGNASYLSENHITIPTKMQHQHEQDRDAGIITVYLAIDRHLAGFVQFKDEMRKNAKATFDTLRLLVPKIVMATGDKATVALGIGKQLGITDIRSELMPNDKIAVVKELRTHFSPVVMVGDGINDAPALALADVGISMSAHGTSAASEAGDITIMVDDVSRVTEAVLLSRRVISIALQSIGVGIGLSITLMLISMLGYIPPVYGALLQEVIDVVVILNALRVHGKFS